MDAIRISPRRVSSPSSGLAKKRPPSTLPAPPAKSLRVLEADDVEAAAPHPSKNLRLLLPNCKSRSVATIRFIPT